MISTETQEKIRTSFDVKHGDYMKKYDLIEKAYMEAIASHGPDGFVLVLEHKLKPHFNDLHVYHYKKAPAGSPWEHIKRKKTVNAIGTIWQQYDIPFMEILQQYCPDLFVVNYNGQWAMIYPYKKGTDKNERYEYFAGNAPLPGAKLDKTILKQGWKMPNELKELYAVHNGFGHMRSVLGNDCAENIYDCKRIELSLSDLDEIAKQNNWDIDYKPSDLLPVFMDSVGNYRAFYKGYPIYGGYFTVDWDHETKEISNSISLAEFMDNQFGHKMQQTGED